MSTFRNPVGPQPSNVYFRRRLVLGLGLLAVIVIILMIIFAPRGDGSSNSSGSPAGNSSATPRPSGGAAAGAAPTTCATGTVAVTAITDANSYAAGVLPQLSLSITNNGAVDCTFSAGSDVQEYRITSGSDQIWNSLDCQSAPVATVVTLTAGETMTTPPIPWDRTRSEPATCAGTRAPVTAGGATYRLKVTVNQVESAEVPFLLY